MQTDEIAKLLRDIARQPRSILFAGAGISARVGMPTWQQWLQSLADVCNQYGDDLSAQLIKHRANTGDFLGAASVYKTCQTIPQGERLAKLAAPFQGTPSKLELLQPLTILPFSGITTTNYDRSFHAAYAKFSGSAARPLELRDETLRNGAMVTEFFIARIHGRAEVPSSIVVDSKDYADILVDAVYNDFLISLFRHRPCLFLGFSFADPAIRIVLEVYKRNFGPNFPSLHAAVIPEKVAGELTALLSEVNIRTIAYDSTDEHKELWRAIRLASEMKPVATTLGLPLSPMLPKDLGVSSMHRVVAFAYARARTPQATIRPALEMVQDGVLLSILNDEPASHLEKESAIERIRALLRIDDSAAKRIFNESLNRLASAGELVETGRFIQRAKRPSNDLENSLTVLSRAVLDRLKVVQNVRLKEDDSQVLNTLWEQIFTIRSWDLAAQYAGSVTSHAINVEDSARSLASPIASKLEIDEAALAGALLHVINYPERAQAEAMAEISRTAIAVQVLMSSPRQSLTHPYTLPTTIYFDASVLLPFIAPGHPLHDGYRSAIQRLKLATKSSGLSCKLVIGQQFTEEILAHRRNAISMVKELDLEDRSNILSHILFYGAGNTNVFVGAFSSLFTRTGSPEKQSFSDFLGTIAPYKNESQLLSFLQTSGIAAEPMKYALKNNVEYNHIYSELLAGYEDLHLNPPKERVLIQHEAQQLTRLFLDAQQKTRSVFVTADKRLQRVVQGQDELEKLTGNVLSEVGFVGLVDLLIGLAPDDQLFTRLVWASPKTDIDKQIRDYLVSVTLAKYDDAMTMAMPEVLKEVIGSLNKNMPRQKDVFRRATSVEDAKKTAKFLDRLENDYFKKMRSAIEEKEKRG